MLLFSLWALEKWRLRLSILSMCCYAAALQYTCPDMYSYFLRKNSQSMDFALLKLSFWANIPFNSEAKWRLLFERADLLFIELKYCGATFFLPTSIFYEKNKETKIFMNVYYLFVQFYFPSRHASLAITWFD